MNDEAAAAAEAEEAKLCSGVGLSVSSCVSSVESLGVPGGDGSEENGLGASSYVFILVCLYVSK